MNEEIKLNNIQQRIYDEYKRTGRVWAECPRMCGKTTLMLKIAVEEIKNGNSVYLKTINKDLWYMFKKKIEQELKKDNLQDNILLFKADTDLHQTTPQVLLYDEIYFQGHLKPITNLKQVKNMQKMVCLRTRPHPIMQFTYKDLPNFDHVGCSLSEIEQKKGIIMGVKEFNIEFEGGLLK